MLSSLYIGSFCKDFRLWEFGSAAGEVRRRSLRHGLVEFSLLPLSRSHGGFPSIRFFAKRKKKNERMKILRKRVVSGSEALPLLALVDDWAVKL